MIKIVLDNPKADHITSKERFLIREALNSGYRTARTRFKGVSIDDRPNNLAGHPWIASIYTYGKTSIGGKPEWTKRTVKIHVK